MRKSIYKVLSFAVAMMLVLSAMVFAEDGAVVKISNAEGKPGDVVEVYVTAENNPGIVVAGFDVKYDTEAFKLIEVIDGTVWGDEMHSPDLTAYPYTLVWFNPTITENITADGILATLKFEILETTKKGTYPLKISYKPENADILDVNMNLVDFSVVDGSIAVERKNKVDENVNSNEEKPEVNDFEEKTEVEENNEVEDEKVQEIIPEIENDKVPEIKPEQEKEDVVEETPEKEEELTSAKRGEDVICLRINTPLAFANGKYIDIDEANDKVVPYIVNDRTLVPLRFVSENLGAEVLWEDGWEYCFVNKGDKKIKITFGSADIEVNGKVITYEAPVEVVEDRTMVPIRFISEELGYHVYWNEANSAVAITPIENPWVESRKAENDLLLDVLMTFLMKGIL